MCFSFPWLLYLFVKFIVVGIVIALYRLWVTPYIARIDPRIVRTIDIILGGVIAIFVLYLLYDLLVCVWSAGPMIGRR